ncbi:hypothetical protein FG93_00987 [Bosea sp. LC85]|nr:hypothetical protein [Bosea sp. LC85]KFC74808.1 hypothetical protein FG93_00987 [Bosea sp. LC85]
MRANQEIREGNAEIADNAQRLRGIASLPDIAAINADVKTRYRD